MEIASSVSETSGGSDLPLVDCPRCNIAVVKLKSNTVNNAGRIFKCKKNKSDDSTCNFFKWEDDYKVYVSKCKSLSEVAAAKSRSKCDVAPASNRIVGSVEAEELKKLNAHITELGQTVGHIGQILVVGFACLVCMLAILVAVLWSKV